jgi:hypothetical protein
MADAGTRVPPSGDNAPRAIDTAMLGSMLNRVRTQAAADPFSNSSCALLIRRQPSPA